MVLRALAACARQQDVSGLEIPVENVLLVHRLHGRGDLPQEQPHGVLAERALLCTQEAGENVLMFTHARGGGGSTASYRDDSTLARGVRMLWFYV